jgi:murein DD-endopeptidase MepM/ murein hydrolase activator NlpD
MNGTRAALAAACLALSVLSACSSIPAAPSAHKGLLDQLSDGSPRLGPGSTARPSAVSARVEKLRRYTTDWRWPLASVKVTSTFGTRSGEPHEGVDLRARTGTPVYASHPGVVLYAGRRLRGYGQLVVLRHRSGLATVYAHNSKLLVRVGQKVRLGQKIAISGATGHVSGPHLHFEVRDGVTALDPVRLLPAAALATARPEFPVSRVIPRRVASNRISHHR